MIIDVRKLNATKRYSGELNFEYNAPEELIDIPFVSFLGPVQISAEYFLLEDDSLELKGKVSFVLTGKCSKCLKETSATVEGEIDAYFEDRKDAEDYSYSGGVIDLKRAVDDAILSAMPRVLSCGEDTDEGRYTF